MRLHVHAWVFLLLVMRTAVRQLDCSLPAKLPESCGRLALSVLQQQLCSETHAHSKVLNDWSGLGFKFEYFHLFRVSANNG